MGLVIAVVCTSAALHADENGTNCNKPNSAPLPASGSWSSIVDKIKTLDELFPYPEPGCLLTDNYPDRWAKDMAMADPDNFHPRDWDFVVMEQGRFQTQLH